MKINFGDLRIGGKAKELVSKALDENWISEGKNTREFEKLFAEKFGYKYAVAMSSGTSACIACLASLYDLGAERGDEVIVPATTFVATANAVLAAGFIPKFVDIELETLNINPRMIESAITDRTIAIMPVHLMGKPCNMDRIPDIAGKNGLIVIEDCCEAHGAKYKGDYVGTIGNMGVFSFYVAHLIACGEGGMAVTDDKNIYNNLRSVKSHGRPSGSIYFDFQRFGLNLKFNDLAAGIGIEGIENFDETFNKRKFNLYSLLGMTRHLSDRYYFIKEGANEVVSPHAFPIVIKENMMQHSPAKRDALYRLLTEKEIECKNLFGSLPTQHKAFEFLGHELGDFPVAEYVGTHGLHFGIHQYLTMDDLFYINDVLHERF